MEVDVSGGLRFGKSGNVIMYRDALSEVCKDVSFENGFEMFLPREDDFELGGRIKRGTDEESEVGEDIGAQKVSLVDEEDGSEV